MGHELPVFLFVLVAAAVAVATLVLAHWISPRRDNPVKLMPYESGMDPVKDARQRFDVRYYLLAIAFLVFDVELLFLYPWAVAAGTVRYERQRIETNNQSAEEPIPQTVNPKPETPNPRRAALSPALQQTWEQNHTLIFLEVLLFLALVGAAYV